MTYLEAHTSMFNEAVTEEHVIPADETYDRIFAAAAEDRSAAIAVVTMAFSTDPIARWVYPDPMEYLSYFPGFIRSFAGRAFDSGTAFVAAGFVGAALWLPPGVEPDGDALAARFDATVDPSLRPELDEMLEQMALYHPTEPHWYLPMIGVDTGSQGKSIGSRLLRHSLSLCDRDGLPAYLESSNPKNISLYERFGFVVKGTIKLGTAPPMYPMLRPARRVKA